MLFPDKYERARKLQQEKLQQQTPQEEYHGEKLHEPTIEEEIEKGDMFALIASGLLTFLPAALLALLAIVFISWILFMH